MIESRPARRVRPAGLLAAALCAALAAGCASMHESPDFERHRFSQLVVPYDRTDIYYFDVTFTPAYPDGDVAAEAQRMAWLDEYIEARGLCPAGFEVIRRRPFDFLEDNPARHDMRYEIACVAAPAAAGQE